MKNNAKKALALALILILCLSVSAFAAEDSSFSLRIEGSALTLFAGEAEIAGDGSVWSSVQAVLEENGISYSASESSYGGIYVSSIGDDYASKYGSWSGWMFTVNGISPSVGMSDYTVSAGDEVLLYFCAYTDSNVADTYVPEITLSPSFPKAGDDLTITVKKTVGYYDESWNYITSTVAAEGAEVTFDSVVYTVGADGSVTIPSLAAGIHSYSVTQETDTYEKLVRTGKLTLAASDTSLPVYVEAVETETGFTVTFVPVSDTTDVQVAYSYKRGNLTVDLVQDAIDITGGYTEDIAVSDGVTVYISVFTGYDINSPVSVNNIGRPAGLAIVTK